VTGVQAVRGVCVFVIGTRLVYDRSFLLECRNSPLANSPPVGLPKIPGVTCTLPPSQMPKNGVNPGKHHGHVGHHGHHVPVTMPSVATNPPVQPKKPQPAGIVIVSKIFSLTTTVTGLFFHRSLTPGLVWRPEASSGVPLGLLKQDFYRPYSKVLVFC